MKILSVNSLRKADQYTIIHEPIASIDLMERAAKTCVHWLVDHMKEKASIGIFCGTGNNGGDGLAIARMLSATGKFQKIEVYIIRYSDKSTSDFDCNLFRLSTYSDIHLIELSPQENQFIIPTTYTYIIDCLIGSGLNKPIEGWLKTMINQINTWAKEETIAIDIPSGWFADQSTPLEAVYIKADYTLTFHSPKLSFMFPESEEAVGEFHIMDIGLDNEFIHNLPSDLFFLTPLKTEAIRKKRKRFTQKGTNGHALIVAGSYGKMGAAVLAAKGCLHIGAGLLTVHLPESGVNIMQTSLPEAMVSADLHSKVISILPGGIERYNAIGIGPGISIHTLTYSVLKRILEKQHPALVLDADALNLISSHPDLLPLLPKQAILTPHIKEFERLTLKVNHSFERFELQKQFSKQHNVIVVLKGAHTCITLPTGEAYFNSTGNPGMATGGCGDVLTGIITGLLAQGYSTVEAALVGVYVHGKAGDLAMQKKSGISLIASDLVNYI